MSPQPSTPIPSRGPVRTWKAFGRKIRPSGCHLLRRLDEFPDSILVTGCQRSGTTILTRILTASDGMVDFRFGADDELDGALILAGAVDHTPAGRYCFQTTYLNECYREYFAHQNGHRILWVIRNPFSVVYSMVRNWRRFALNELFDACGRHLADDRDRRWMTVFGRWAVSPIRRAAYSFAGKTAQLFELRERLDGRELAVVEYDDLVRSPDTVLPAIYRFAGLTYRREYAAPLHNRSLSKSDRLSFRDRKTVDVLCTPIYRRAQTLKTVFPDDTAGEGFPSEPEWTR